MKEKLVGKKGVIPEVGERSPETGFSGRVSARKLQNFGRNINKNKAILRREMRSGLAHSVQHPKNVDAFR